MNFVPKKFSQFDEGSEPLIIMLLTLTLSVKDVIYLNLGCCLPQFRMLSGSIRLYPTLAISAVQWRVYKPLLPPRRDSLWAKGCLQLKRL